MYAGGYVDEFTLVMASENGDLSEVRWTVILYWVVMGLLAIATINSQLADRKQHLEAYDYKFNSHAQYDTYAKRMNLNRRERMGRYSDDQEYDMVQGDGDDESEMTHDKRQ